MKPSPIVLTSLPPCFFSASRVIRSCSRRTARAAASPSRSVNAVEPSTSVKRIVCKPPGDLAAAAAGVWEPRTKSLTAAPRSPVLMRRASGIAAAIFFTGAPHSPIALGGLPGRAVSRTTRVGTLTASRRSVMSISSLASECATQVAGVIPDRIAAAYSFDTSLSANPKPTAAMLMQTRSHCCSANGRIAKRTRFPGNI